MSNSRYHSHSAWNRLGYGIHTLRQIDSRQRNEVTEITLNLSDSMHRICQYAVPRAKRVIDRFQVQKLALEAVRIYA